MKTRFSKLKTKNKGKPGDSAIIQMPDNSLTDIQSNLTTTQLNNKRNDNCSSLNITSDNNETFEHPKQSRAAKRRASTPVDGLDQKKVKLSFKLSPIKEFEK